VDARLHQGLNRTRLRWVLGLLFVALALPSAVLIVQTQRQLKFEALHQQRELAAELAARVDAQLRRLVADEEARSHADYAFLTVAGDGADAAVLQRSPLARLPVPSDWPGLLGWFQIDPDGSFSTPLLPGDAADAAALGLLPDDVLARTGLRDRLLDVLASNRLAERRRISEPSDMVTPKPIAGMAPAVDAGMERAGAGSARPGRADAARAEADVAEVAPAGLREAPSAPAAQVEFDRLNVAPAAAPVGLGKVADLRLDSPMAVQSRAPAPAEAMHAEPVAPRERRLEKSVQPAAPALARAGQPVPVRMFESELDPFEFARLDSGHFVLFRRVWRNGERSIQGALIEADEFLRGALAAPFGTSVLASSADMLVAWQGDVIERVPGRASRMYMATGDALSGTLLHRARLSAPLSDLELLWTLRQLPAAPGAAQLAWSGAVLFGVLLLGFAVLYRLGLRQIQLARQQHDFIAAVSHELKTPLTSIRMYGELLRAGWASEEKKREYYDYIHDESERLSRLITNVLQLARLERNELQLELRTYPAPMLFDLVRSRVQAQIESAGFEVGFGFDPACTDLQATVDADALVQILINLVDNALKFSARSPRQRVEIAMARRGDRLQLAVRDYGPGVPPALRRRIFELFFRAGNELTRETRGTGIGLALVRQLAQGMGGEVEVVAGDPGAEFRLLLPLAA
jgi:signal transduction histidine kinase